MWLIVREADDIVVGTNYTRQPEVPLGHRVVEWHGDEPAVEDVAEGVAGDVDPTLTDPDYSTFLEGKVNLEEIEEQATNEIAWLLTAIEEVDSADLTALKTMFKRVLQEQLREVRAWRYVIRRFT